MTDPLTVSCPLERFTCVSSPVDFFPRSPDTGLEEDCVRIPKKKSDANLGVRKAGISRHGRGELKRFFPEEAEDEGTRSGSDIGHDPSSPGDPELGGEGGGESLQPPNDC